MLFLAVLEQLEDEERKCAEDIYNEYGKRIYEVAYKIVKNRLDAEDVLDSVMISIMRNIDKFIFAEKKSVEAQIYTYTRNEAINLYNKLKRKSKRELPISELENQGKEIEMIDDSADVERIVVQKETVRIVQANIEQLPDAYEDVLSLFYLYGYSYSEIATILHISENAVALKIFRSKKKLVKLAGDELYERTEQ